MSKFVLHRGWIVKNRICAHCGDNEGVKYDVGDNKEPWCNRCVFDIFVLKSNYKKIKYRLENMPSNKLKSLFSELDERNDNEFYDDEETVTVDEVKLIISDELADRVLYIG